MSFREGHFYIPNQNTAENFTEKLFENSQSIDFQNISKESLAGLWHKTIQDGMHGICFSLYENDQRPGDIISEEQVSRRIKILKPHTSWIRSFSCTEGNEHIPKIAHQNGLKTLVGAWLGNDLECNELEIEALISLANQGFVDVAAVGNEVMYRGDLTEEQLIDYINRVKLAIPNIPVGYVDAYYEFSHRPKITDACDIILTNCYPYWEGCPIEYSLDHMQSMFFAAKNACQNKRIMITETGWPSQGGSLKAAVATNENAMRYFIETQNWCKQNEIEIFYFSSFDEAWKVGPEGEVGGYWGLWDKNEQLKFI